MELYRTDNGMMLVQDSLAGMRKLPDDSVDLVLTSPPYALHFKKEYGNADQKEYVKWFLPFAREIRRIIKPSGSFVLNVGGAWTPGKPIRSLYHYRLLMALCDEVEFELAQEFFWHNPAKMPSPAEWVNVRRIRVKDSVEYIFWLVKSPEAHADNRRVLAPYSPDMKRLIRRGVKEAKRPSGHIINGSFATDQGGSIPPNLLTAGNNESNSSYIKQTKLVGQKVHPARFPSVIPDFFIRFLTEEQGLVVDPFAGSNTTGWVAEGLNRQWISYEQDLPYAENSRLRFESESYLPKVNAGKDEQLELLSEA